MCLLNDFKKAATVEQLSLYPSIELEDNTEGFIFLKGNAIVTGNYAAE